MHSGVGDVIAPDQFVGAVHVHVVFVAVVALAVLFRPACVYVLVHPFRRFVGPILGHLALFDGSVCVTRVVVARHRHDGGVQDLSSSRNIALPRQMTVEQLK